MRVGVTGQLTSCFNESEGKIQVNLLRVLMKSEEGKTY